MSPIRPEYPRPHLDRSHSWLSLNGQWDFRSDPAGNLLGAELSDDQSGWAAQIVVPFAWETEASGVHAHWLIRGWYRRDILRPAQWSDQRLVLHFGAVHHAAEVWVNGIKVGEHEGGYTPFEFDITDALHPDGNATVLVGVSAPVDKREIVHGKQRSIPRDDYDMCAFTPSSGIWQSVWLEARPATYVRTVALTASDDLQSIVATVAVAGPGASGAHVRLAVADQPPMQVDVAHSTQPVVVSLPITAPRQWSPRDPYLYDVTVEVSTDEGTDRVTAYTGLRRIEADGDRLFLNGERLYVRGVLDQGYWPETGITAPDDDAFVADLELARGAGFTVVRKHLKLEDPRFLYHADRLGMLVWAEPASTGVYSTQAAARFEAQIEPMVQRDGNHPSIVIWGLYNEEWGLDWDVPADPVKQDAIRRAYHMLKALDPHRPVVDNSGWSHVSTDIVDWHIYDDTPRGWAQTVHALMVEEKNTFPVGIGGGVIVDKALMAVDVHDRAGKPNLNSEFGGGFTPVERGWNLRWQTLELRRYDSIAGYVWTELYDVEHEMAGIYTFDRKGKDTGGNEPAHTNADTVIIPRLTPLAPGRDAQSYDGTVEFDVQISHHGPAAIDADIIATWGPLLGTVDPTAHSATETPPRIITSVKADPYTLSEAVRVSAHPPVPGTPSRLHLALVAAGTVIARTQIDVSD